MHATTGHLAPEVVEPGNGSINYPARLGPKDLKLGTIKTAVQILDLSNVPVDTRAVVLVEGISDRIAVETLAARLGRNLESEGVAVVPMGGAQAIGRFLARFGPQGAKLRLAGLYDVGEEGVVRRGLEHAGFGSGFPLTRSALEELGFYVCVVDLEDELIRALGAAAVQAVIASQGELDSFRTMQKQPAWRGQRVEAQLRRFMGSGGGRKIRYARLLVDGLDLARVPRPLHLVLAHAGGRAGATSEPGRSP